MEAITHHRCAGTRRILQIVAFIAAAIPDAGRAQTLPTEPRFYEDTEPPRASGRTEIPCNRIRPNGSDRSLGAAVENVTGILREAGYTTLGYFLTHPVMPPQRPLPDSSQINGLAIVTALNKAQRETSWLDYIWGAPPRRDRLFAFFIVRGGFGRAMTDTLSHGAADAWYQKGAAITFTRLRSMPWQNHACVAVVYVFERTGPGGTFVQIQADAVGELKDANLWQAFAPQ
jgi:hypothetical protein